MAGNLSYNFEDECTSIPELPASFFPSCWTDEQRMNVLFAPFRERSVNPINYDSKLKFWTNLIRKYGETKGCAKVTLPELRQVFQWNNKKPYALEKVLEEMSASGEAKTLAVFMEPPQHTWSGWAKRSVTKAMVWPILKVKDQLWRSAATSSGSNESNQSYVVYNLVQSQADQLLAKCPHTNCVVDIETIYADTSELTREGTELALHQLHCTKRAAIVDHTTSNGTKLTLVKLAGPLKSVTEITQSEINLFDLNVSLDKITQQSEMLEQEIQEIDTQIRQLVKENKKTSAKVQLRKKKLLEAQLLKCTSILTNIQSMKSSIDDTKQTADILATYKLASSTLKQSYADTGITMESVDDALADIQEVMDDHRNIQEVLSGPTSPLQLGGTTNEDDLTLEAELNELLELDKLEAQQRDKELDESIDRRLKQLNITGFADLSVEEQREIIGNSLQAGDELLKYNKKKEMAPQ